MKKLFSDASKRGDIHGNCKTTCKQNKKFEKTANKN